ncbi:hypothetical protein HNV10_01775 [Winogradskyella litoriviva]|uniref:Uncharacterized protein n=1 Tax=Winogradskyella litoriviva TaxID=1220182 RepID=A0ABX2E1V4_9FLAO|nr:hypothetical protein [Winogradskyella litoriviva]NRD21951.1 hypothetical protein [Winogradskyella litoriviva]
MSLSQFFTLKQARISNNCPECYSNDSLELTIKQKLIETQFYKSITNEIVSEICCLNCDVQIFPIRWTDDIEQVVNYHKRGLNKKPMSLKLKPMSWGIITFLIVIITAVILISTGIIAI